jgi:hypothetical protein
MVRLVLILVLFAIVALLIYASTRPSTFRTQRSASIRAPADKIFAIINDHSNWASWSPWQKLDPAMNSTISNPSSGVGATYEWNGNSKAGSGRVTIIESVPPSKLRSHLEMFKPFKAENSVEFTLEQQGDSTNVSWGMSGKQNLMMKVMGLFVNCNELVGKDFEAGLANLKAIAEK